MSPKNVLFTQSALVMEVITGKGVLGQLGVNPGTIKAPFLIGLAFLFIGGLLGGYVVVNNPPDLSKAPPNAGDGTPRNPLKTYDSDNLDPMTTYSRGGLVTRPDGQVATFICI
jgi:hypothetical protein